MWGCAHVSNTKTDEEHTGGRGLLRVASSVCEPGKMSVLSQALR